MAYLHKCPLPECGRVYRIDVMYFVKYYGDWDATQCPDYPHIETRCVEIPKWGVSLIPALRSHREYLRKLEALNWEIVKIFA